MKVADFIYFLNLRGILFSQPQDWLHLKLGSLLVMEWLPGIIGLHISSHSIRKRRGSFPMIFPQRERKKKCSRNSRKYFLISLWPAFSYMLISEICSCSNEDRIFLLQDTWFDIKGIWSKRKEKKHFYYEENEGGDWSRLVSLVFGCIIWIELTDYLEEVENYWWSDINNKTKGIHFFFNISFQCNRLTRVY